jgi:hypothetical protein
MISDEEGRERPITTITTAATRRSRRRLIDETTVVLRRGVPDVVNTEFLCSSQHQHRQFL